MMDAVKLETHDDSTVDDHETKQTDEMIVTAATVGVVAVGVAMFEAALLPGVVLGVAAMWAPKYFPKVVGSLNPLFRSGVRGVYKFAQKTKEVVAEAQEHVHDIVAEVHAEDEAKVAEAQAPAATAAETGVTEKARK